MMSSKLTKTKAPPARLRIQRLARTKVFENDLKFLMNVNNKIKFKQNTFT